MFVTSERTLYFKKVCVNATCATNIYLENVGHVTAFVSVKLESTQCFDISPDTLKIDPYSVGQIAVTFSPNCIGVSKLFTFAYNIQGVP